jgi:hypothetical protein
MDIIYEIEPDIESDVSPTESISGRGLVGRSIDTMIFFKWFILGGFVFTALHISVSEYIHPYNALSSVLYAVPIPFARPAFRLPLAVLAVSSFLLWANDGGDITAFIDVTSVHWVVISMTISKSGSQRCETTGWVVNLLFAAYMAGSVLMDTIQSVNTYYSNNYIVTIGMVVMMSNIGLYDRHGVIPGLVVGTALSIIGFWCKIMDTFDGFSNGTALFHFLTAAGILSVVLI